MKYCGISLTPRRIVAAINGPTGACNAFRVPRAHGARCDLLYAMGLHLCTLVMDGASWREDAVGEVALSMGAGVCIAPAGLVNAIVSAAGVSTSAERRAEILSRLALLSWTRGYLRTVRHSGNDPRQQQLW